MKPGLTRKEIRKIEAAYLDELDWIAGEMDTGMRYSLRQLNRRIEWAFTRYLHRMELNPVTQQVLDTSRNRSLLRALKRRIDAERQIYLLAQGKRQAKKAVKRGFRAAKTRSNALYGTELSITAIDARRLTEYERLSHVYINALERQTADHLRHVLTRGKFEGWSPRQIANSIVEGGKLKAGPVQTVQTRAELWARTEPARVAEETHMRKFIEASGTSDPYGQWIALKDKRAGADSLARHGKVLKKSRWMTKRFSTDKYTGIPPLRPNDRCSIQWLDPEDWTEGQWKQIMAGTPWYNVMN